jgi:hypothetical protein
MGVMWEDFKRNSVIWKLIVVMISGLLLSGPVLIVSFGWEFLKLCYESSGIANYIFVHQFKRGKKTLDQESLDILTRVSELKKAKKRKSINDRIYIWGAAEILKIHNLNKNK